jgi:hypothetical protein
MSKRACLALSIFLSYSILYSQNTTFGGSVGRIIEDCTSGVKNCCSPSTIPSAIYNASIQGSNLINGASINVIQGSSGSYSVTLLNTTGGLVTISASAGTQYVGLSTFDVVRISQHRQLIKLFECPLSRIAADVDNDGKITLADEDIVRQFVLTVTTSLPVPPWRFVPKFYVKPTPNHPDQKFLEDFWNNAYANTSGVEYPFNAVLKHNGKFYSYNGASSWMTKLESIPVEQQQSSLCWSTYNYDFYGVASGDANYSGSPANVPFAPGSEQSIGFDRVIAEQNNLRSANERYEVKVVAIASENVHGYQLGIKFDEKVFQFEKVKPEKELQKQTERNFGALPRQTEKGELRVAWTNDYSVSKQGILANQEFEVFSFNLKAKSNGKKLEESIQIDEKILSAEFIGFDNLIANDKVKFVLKTRLLRPDEE